MSRDIISHHRGNVVLKVDGLEMMLHDAEYTMNQHGEILSVKAHAVCLEEPILLDRCSSCGRRWKNCFCKRAKS